MSFPATSSFALFLLLLVRITFNSTLFFSVLLPLTFLFSYSHSLFKLLKFDHKAFVKSSGILFDALIPCGLLLLLVVNKTLFSISLPLGWC